MNDLTLAFYANYVVVALSTDPVVTTVALVLMIVSGVADIAIARRKASRARAFSDALSAWARSYGSSK